MLPGDPDSVQISLLLRPRVFALVFLAIAICALPMQRASATTVVPLTLEEMNRAASDVVVGTVVSKKAAWDKDHRLIETRVLIKVDQRVKGNGKRVLTVVVPGGNVGDIGMRTPGAAVFTPGERLLLLAEPKGPGEVRPVGMFQGKMPITRDEARGLDMVRPPGPAWGTEGEPIPPGKVSTGAPHPLPLEEVLRRLGSRP